MARDGSKKRVNGSASAQDLFKEELKARQDLGLRGVQVQANDEPVGSRQHGQMEPGPLRSEVQH
jgi:hypothetical protein